MKMDITSYLLELIETQKAVGINGLGTLYKKKTPGRYDSETHSFLPPKFLIEFTSDIREDDSLANFISEKKDISIESANYYITEFVEHIQAQLEDHQQADFSPIGELKLSNDQILLEKATAIGLGFDFFGLPSISASVEEKLELEQEQQKVEEDNTPAISGEEQEEEPVYDEIDEVANLQNINNEQIIKEEQDEITEEALNKEEDQILPIDDISDAAKEIDELATHKITDPLWKPTVISRYEYEDDDDDENKGKGFRLFLKIIVVIAIVATVIGGLVYFISPDLYDKVKENFSAQAVESEPIVLANSSDTTNNATQQKIDSAISDSLKKAIALKEVPKDTIVRTPIPNQTIVYEVIGSAMKTQKKVDEVISILSKRGINARKLEAMPGKLIKISLGSFTDYNMAKKFQDSLKIKLKNPEIYIQTIKPKN